MKIPPRVAPIQVIIVPILSKKASAEQVLSEARAIRDSLSTTIRIRLDERDDRSPSFKFNHWELRGVPIRMEIGPRDLLARQVVLVRRDTGEKMEVPIDELKDTLPRMLAEIQKQMFSASQERLNDLTENVDDWATLSERVASNAGWNRVWWCGEEACETKVKNDTKATIRCIPLDQPGGSGPCIVCGRQSHQKIIIARAY